jgi:tetratricopeptide (TPR) repeat protein
LAEQYSDSSFYTETLLELARLYTELGEYQKSVSAYSRYLASNPAEEAGREARVQIDTLKRIIAGQNTREAELTVQLERYGLKEKQGREAALELARLYLYQYPEKTGGAYDLLRRLKEKEGLERNTAAQAEYLTGEYFRKKSQYGDAASAYARAAVAGAGDDDLVARSLLKAAESAEEAGDFRTARQMVQKLKADFPHTQWVIEGEALLDRIERKD